MENVPERQNPNAHLRASDEDRDRVVDVLRDSLMAGRLTQEEHAERLEATLMAKTLGELEPITQDLVVPGSVPAASRAVSRIPIEVPARPEDSFESMVAIFGGGDRKGRWRVKRRTNVLAVFGGYDLDMTDAVFEGREVVVSTFAMFGGVNITVPDGVEVRNQGSGIFGGYGAEGSENPDPNAPVVVLKGVAIFGGVGGETASKRRSRDKKKSHGHGHSAH
jgi:Domain of unknown function (DUF1707)/Cell wall-active antibiotics response 4TMS YvqF